MLKFRIVVVMVVLALIMSVLGVGASFAQDKAGSFTATPLTPDSIEQGTKPDTPNGSQPMRRAESAAADTQMVSVIVKLDVDPVASYQGGKAGFSATSPDVTGAAQLDLSAPNVQRYQAYVDRVTIDFAANATKSVAGAEVTNRYTVIFGGVSMVLPADQVDALYKLPGVVAVYPDELLHPDTDNSPQFIGAPTAWKQLGGQKKAGEGVVVGVLDTGIWPEHPSYSDPDQWGKPYAPPPNWSGTACQFGSSVPGDVPFTCNNKLVGAQRFMNTYDVVIGLVPGEFPSARDDDGHGTHTSSTAAGNGNVASSIFGVSRGIVSGIAPRASVAAYKVCGIEGCFSSDSAAAVQQAILDGVNAINFSISGGTNPYADVVSQAFLDAYNAGVFVAASAGNSGPAPDTVNHREPWVTTVAASTQDRAFESTATVTGSGGASLSLTGTTITDGIGPAEVVVPPAASVQCNTPFAPGSVAGKIVVCQRGTTGRTQKGWNVLQGGAVGMILYNQSPAVTDLETDNHFLPAVQIQYSQGQSLLSFLAANPGATASWPAGAKVSAQGDVMASFSSRGGPGQTLGISKPDITAPGVQILAGLTPLPVQPPYYYASGPTGEYFQAIAGTSMSSPHIAGSGALMKALHPDWTPGQIRSALMTTAKTSVVKEDGVTPANPFDDGSGRVDLNKAGTAGLTFDETGANYVALKDRLWDANYPSLYVPVMPGQITVKRTVKNVTGKTDVWKLSVSAPSDVTVIVPHHLVVKKNGSATFEITVDARAVPLGEVRHATLELKQGYDMYGKFDKHYQGGTTLHFPITIVRKQPVVTLTKTCDPANLKLGDMTTCTVTATNTGFAPANVKLTDQLPSQLELKTVTGGTKYRNMASFNGTLAGAQPPDVNVGVGSSPAGGYLPLSAFGIAPLSGIGDETIVNFNVPAFTYAGETYTRIGLVSNGYLVVGGGTGGDVQFVNQNLPDAAPPNNVLAPFWTDLNPGAGGAIRVGSLTDGVNSWLVFDFNNVPNYTGGNNTFQVWVGTGAVEDISFSYGPQLTTGDGGFLTIGAENRFGNRGANYYFNGTGTFPGANFDAVVVTSSPPAPGETHVMTLTAKADKKGTWTNCAEMKGDTFFGTNISCFSGQVTKK
jgi:uncharacterized repeat protein (TIGR01451 family)